MSEQCFGDSRAFSPETKEDAKRDWELLPENPDPDYSEFCNDIFGDG